MTPPAKRPHFSKAFQKKETPEAPVETPKVETTSTPTASRKVKPKVTKQKSRIRKVQLPVYVSPETRKQVKVLCAERECTQEDLLREALDDVFKKYGKPRIAV